MPSGNYHGDQGVHTLPEKSTITIVTAVNGPRTAS
jgi:hypothetical protein